MKNQLALKPSYWASVSGGCMFCPMASRKNLAYLYKFYPNQYALLIALMRETEEIRKIELGRPFAVMSSNPKYNAEYIDNNIKNKWYPLLFEESDAE